MEWQFWRHESWIKLVVHYTRRCELVARVLFSHGGLSTCCVFPRVDHHLYRPYLQHEKVLWLTDETREEQTYNSVCNVCFGLFLASHILDWTQFSYLQTGCCPDYALGPNKQLAYVMGHCFNPLNSDPSLYELQAQESNPKSTQSWPPEARRWHASIRVHDRRRRFGRVR